MLQEETARLKAFNKYEEIERVQKMAAQETDNVRALLTAEADAARSKAAADMEAVRQTAAAEMEVVRCRRLRHIRFCLAAPLATIMNELGTFCLLSQNLIFQHSGSSVVLVCNVQIGQRMCC